MAAFIMSYEHRSQRKFARYTKIWVCKSFTFASTHSLIRQGMEDNKTSITQKREKKNKGLNKHWNNMVRLVRSFTT